MYGLPSSTERKQQLPKKAIYSKFELKPSQRDSFDSDIAHIDIVAVISPETIPAISVGESIKEFYILDIQLKHKNYDIKNIIMLTKLIDQKMIFSLKYEGQIQFAVFHKKLFISEWLSSEQATLPLSGLSIDTIWNNIVTEIGQINIEGDNTLESQITANEKQAKIHAQIESIERKMAKEKQPRRKREYFEMIHKLKEQL